MKKLLQNIFCYKNIEVTDANTGRKEIAQYRMILGFPFKITYAPVDTSKSSDYIINEITVIISNTTPVLE
ncbi:hypothetical protein AB670_02791 [Chryseobacterium sp. MOF25P]|uniref:hypothetical protein n=1 Tax=unclassified Chryseobacterium TaxID=2593645 RepID=UPI000805617E|nr:MULTISPECIES: hypothetical protein [unclassified Chryseobacterium]OBW40840.1 hypothetical protein AB670_02791 [Chryseobacterium sp. MOF25P]OBW45304.1 hypothetical protein AB671_02601 [Chryseobacterium sp. BGARF1]